LIEQPCKAQYQRVLRQMQTIATEEHKQYTKNMSKCHRWLVAALIAMIFSDNVWGMISGKAEYHR